MELEIIKRYTVDLVGSIKIAREFGITKDRVLKILESHGIKRRNIKRPDLLSEQIAKIYDEERLSVNQIAERLGVTQSAISYRLKKLGKTLSRKDRVGCKHHNWTGCGDICGSHWRAINYSARAQKIPFNLEIEYGWELYLKQNRKCALSGMPIFFAQNDEEFRLGQITTSLNRIDSNLGYVVGNVQWLHKDVSIMKGRFSQEYFTSVCSQIHTNLEKKSEL